MPTRRAWPAALLVLAMAMPGSAQARSGGFDRLFHQAWSLREGAPGAISSIAQSHDGSLWLASPDGVYRFDGLRFERLQLPGAPIRRPIRVWTFADDSTWLAFENGSLLVLRDGVRTTYTANDGLPVSRSFELIRDRDGVMWTCGERGLARLDGPRWTVVVPVELGPTAVACGLFEDSRGALWASNGGETRLRRPGTATFETVVSHAITQFAQAPNGTIWAVPRAGLPLQAFADDAGRPVGGPGAGIEARRVAVDRQGTLWVASEAGVLRARTSSSRATIDVLDRMTAAQGLTHDSVLAVFVDREDNVWVGTAGGLDLFRETVVTNADPLPPMHAARLAVHGDDVWAASRAGLVRARGGAVTPVRIDTPVTAVRADADGTIWAWGGQHLWRGSATTPFVRVAGTPAGSSDEAWELAVDGSGRRWATFLRSGLWRLDGHRWARPERGAPPPERVATVHDDGHGVVWASDAAGAWVARTTGREWHTVLLPEGPAFGQISGLAVDGARTWLAGRGGLAAIDADVVHRLRGLDEDTLGIVRGLARDSDGALWLNAGRGIVRIAADEAAGAAADPSVTPRYRVFDHLDGMIGGSAPRPPHSAIVAPTGAVWFVGFDAVYAIDPRRLAAASEPPPVRVTLLRTGMQDVPAAEGLTLPIGTTNLRIAYTGLSLTMPDRVRFRYQLEGVDQGWQDAGDRREVSYTNLPPGAYRFRVIASNNNGVWPETGATTSFVVPPAIHQTTAFRVGAGLAVLALLWAAFRLRVRQVTAAVHGRLEARVAERERIARELHDTLLQGVQGLTLRFQAIASRLPAGDPAAAQMEDALSRADDVLAEGRRRVRDLRHSAEAGDDLPEALARAGQAATDGTGIDFVLTVEGPEQPLHPIVRDEVYWIAHEAVTNAVRHAAGRRVEAEIEYGASALRVRCRDDGTGIAEPRSAGDRSHHFGMRGMHERAARIGAALHVWSRPGMGTEVEVRVPAAMAYAAATASRWTSLRRAWSGQ